MKQVSEIVEKKWGKEIIFSNNSLYCGKLLCFNKGSQFSMHFHIKKDETWYVNSGKIKVSWIDTVTAEVIEDTLEVGDVWRNEPVVGEEFSRAVAFYKKHKGYSTTRIIDQITLDKIYETSQ